MLAYGRVWSRVVEWLQVGDVRHDTAVSLYPTIASFNTYRLPHTPIASLISHIGCIGYARLILPPSYPISATPIDELYEAVCVCVSYIYVCMYVYMYVCMCVCMYVCVCVCVCV